MSATSALESTRSADLVRPSERLLFGVVVVVSLLVYGWFAFAALTVPALGVTMFFYAVILTALALVVHGLALGRIRGNGILVSPRQLPLLDRLVADHARKLGMSERPDLYVVESGGVLNAFATRFLGRDFVVVHSDVLELALQRGHDAVSFVVAHELGHVWRGHLKLRWLTLPGRLIPYLGSAYSRSCEYTCDRVGAFCQPEGAISGLLALAAGKQLYSHVDSREFSAQAETDGGFWIGLAELLSTHPRLPKRVAALMDAGLPPNPVSQVPSA